VPYAQRAWSLGREGEGEKGEEKEKEKGKAGTRD
jgi:hypothetical protein